MKPLLSLGLFLLVAAAVYAQTAPQVSISVSTYGVYSAVTEGVDPATMTNGTRQETVKSVSLVKQTRTVVVGNATGPVRFGYNYTLLGSPKDAEISLRMVIRFPEPGVVRNSKRVLWDEYVVQRRIGHTNYTGFEFDDKNDRDIVPGDWTFEIWYGNEKLSSQTFTVVK